MDDVGFIAKSSSLPVAWEKTKFRVRRRISSTVEMLRGSPKVAQRSSEELPMVLVGPVIGKVTCTTARILLEVDKDEIVTVGVIEYSPSQMVRINDASGSFLRRLGTSLSFSIDTSEESIRSGINFFAYVEKQLIGRHPAVLEFQNLIPGMRYRVEVHCSYGRMRGAVSSSFRTFPENHAEVFDIGVISCNKIFVTTREVSAHSDLWSHLAKGIESGKIDLLVHLGDQIYGDGDRRHDAEAGHDCDKWSNRFRKSKEKIKNIPRGEWKNYMKGIIEEYREVYRHTWQHPPTAKCLANCPNLMIYDDHEIRDNWGDVEGDWLQDSDNFFVARCAWIASLEYQRQLYEDVDFQNLHKINKDFHLHKISNIGFMFLDIRGSRTFHRDKDDKTPYLGSRQWVDIRLSLDSRGLFSDVKMLLLCSPAPLVFLQQALTKTVADNVNRLEDFKGHWSVHPDEQVCMIDCLFNWKASKENREVLILGGDVHCGGHSIICNSESMEIFQLTSSAIANRPLPKSVYYTLRLAEQLGGLNSTYMFKHHNWTRARNYGLVRIKNHRNQDKGEPDITCQLVRGKYVSGIKMGSKSENQAPYMIKSQNLHCYTDGSIHSYQSGERLLESRREAEVRKA